LETLAESGSAKLQSDLDRSYSDLIKLLRAGGQPEEALQALQDGIIVLEAFVKRSPHDRGLQQRLGNRLTQTANLLSFELQRYEQAEPLFRRVLAIRQTLAEEAAGDFDNRQQLAWSFQNLGWTLNNLHRAEEAEALLRKAVALCESLASESPLNSGNQVNLAWSLNVLARALAGLGRIGEARETLQRALGICEQTLQKDPSHSTARTQLDNVMAQLDELPPADGEE